MRRRYSTSCLFALCACGTTQVLPSVLSPDSDVVPDGSAYPEAAQILSSEADVAHTETKAPEPDARISSRDGQGDCLECWATDSGEAGLYRDAGVEAAVGVDADSGSCTDQLNATVNAIKQCSSDADCTFQNEYFCCRIVATAFSVGNEGTFADASAAYLACAGRCMSTCVTPYVSESGQVVYPQSDGGLPIVARCDNGHCTSHAL